MLRIISLVTIFGIVVTVPAWAQKPANKIQSITPAALTLADKAVAKPQTVVPAISPGELKATPEMWFYEQYMQQYQDPKMAVRAKAEFRADQRQRRLAAMQWFGLSNSRPHACTDPYHGDWSPGWTGIWTGTASS